MRLSVLNDARIRAVSAPIADEFGSLVGRINKKWAVEHAGDGSHGDIHAESVAIADGTPPSTDGTIYRSGNALYWNGFLIATGSATALSGAGTATNLVKWTGAGASTTIGNSIATESGTTITVAGTVAATALSANTSVLSVSLTTPLLSSSANLTLNPTGSIVVSKNVLPDAGYARNLGALTNKFLTIHAAELWVETLVAQNTIATIGGRVIVAPTDILAADVSTGATSITVKYNNLSAAGAGDVIYLEANGNVEFMRVVSGPAGSAGAYVYAVTRNLDGSGANAWSAGDAIVNTGQTGKGFIDLYSVSGVLSGSGPTIVGNVRTSNALYSDISPRWAIGNLNGVYGYGVETYGAAFGDPSGAWLKIDTTNGVRIGFNATTLTQIDGSGNATFTGTVNATAGFFGDSSSRVAIEAAGINVGSTGSIRGGQTAYATGTGFWIGLATGTPKLSVGVNATGLTFDGTWVTVGSLKYMWTGSNASRHGMIGFWSSATAVLGGTPEPQAAIGIDAINLGPSGGATTREVLDIYNNYPTGGLKIWCLTTIASTLTVTGSVTFSGGATAGQQLQLSGATTGTAHMIVTNTGGSAYFGLESSTSSFFGTSAYSGVVYSNTAGGVTLFAQHASGEIRFYTGGSSLRTKIDANGDYFPATDNTMRVGLNANRFTLIRGVTITSGDLCFENGWTITESNKVGIADEGLAILDATGELVVFIGKTGFRRKGGKADDDIDSQPYVRTTPEQRAQMDEHPEQRTKIVAVPAIDASGKPVMGTNGQPQTATREVPKTAADVLPMPDFKNALTNLQRRTKQTA